MRVQRDDDGAAATFPLYFGERFVVLFEPEPVGVAPGSPKAQAWARRAEAWLERLRLLTTIETAS